MSDLLFNTLELIGASEVGRRIRSDDAKSKEILLTVNERVVHRMPHSMYLFGSTSEGTTTYGLRSDVDIMICAENIVIKEYIDRSPRLHFLMIRDKTTKPGYVKLQLVVDAVGITVLNKGADIPRLYGLDKKGRIVMPNRSYANYDNSRSLNWHGPAVTQPGNTTYNDVDYVNSKRYRQIPKFALRWIDRERQFGWPPRECLDKMKTQGCFLVRKGHPMSEETHLEWRVSFSLQERLLMESLNPTQYKTYIILKMIKKDLIESEIGESISSYHLKTSLFYTIETTDQNIWVPRKLIKCIAICFETLCTWLQNENCPNYFVPEENMFDKLGSETMLLAASCISRILKRRPIWSCIRYIRCDNLGYYFHCENDIIRTRNIANVQHEYIVNFVINQIYNKQRIQNCCLFNIFTKCVTMDTLALHQYLLHKLYEIETIGPVAEHDTESVRNALTQTKCMFHLHIAICIASLIRQKSQYKLASRSFEYHIKKADGFDLISALLVNATVCLNFGNTKRCREILSVCENLIGPTNISYGILGLQQLQIPEWLVLGFQRTNQSFEEMLTHRAASCLIFHPSEANIVPTALLYEMYRSEYTSPVQRKTQWKRWFDWIVVDSKVYFCFLMYVLLRQKSDLKRFDYLHELEYILENDYCPGHTETGYNLAGWVYTQENMPHAAIEYFVKSWRLRPHHNAAKWHVLCLLYGVLHQYP